MKKFHRRRSVTVLSFEDSTVILPFLNEGIEQLKRVREVGCTDDAEAEQLVRKLYRLEQLRSRIARSFAEQWESDVGREPEFIQAVRQAIEDDTL